MILSTKGIRDHKGVFGKRLEVNVADWFDVHIWLETD